MGGNEIPKEVSDALLAKLLLCQREGGSIYDDGDPLGCRNVTVQVAARRWIRIENLTVKAMEHGPEFGSWNMTVHWERMIECPALDEYTTDEDRYRHGKDLGGSD